MISDKPFYMELLIRSADNYYQLTVSKELYEAYGKAEEKCLRYGVNGL
jgi:hypothetical protein